MKIRYSVEMAGTKAGDAAMRRMMDAKRKQIENDMLLQKKKELEEHDRERKLAKRREEKARSVRQSVICEMQGKRGNIKPNNNNIDKNNNKNKNNNKSNNKNSKNDDIDTKSTMSSKSSTPSILTSTKTPVVSRPLSVRSRKRAGPEVDDERPSSSTQGDAVLTNWPVKNLVSVILIYSPDVLGKWAKNGPYLVSILKFDLYFENLPNPISGICC